METPSIIKEEVIIKAEMIEPDEMEANNLPAKVESVSKKKMLKCDECEMTFVKSWALMSHKRTHSRQKPFKLKSIIKEELVIEYKPTEVEENAEIKSETFSSDEIEADDNVAVNDESVSSKRRFKCDVCDKVFIRPSLLVYHKRVHTGEKPYKCSECNFASNRSGGLKAHKMVHSGEKPYPCDLCDYAAPQSAILKLHKRIHTGERPYKCDLCDKFFRRKNHVASHRRTHTGEKIVSQLVLSCLKCEFTTNSKGNLNAHQATHSEARPFACNQCDFAFKDKATLKKHERRHSGERPYTCEVCGKKFAQSGALSAHKKRIHLKDKM